MERNRDHERALKALKKEQRDQKAYDAWYKWKNNPRNCHLSTARTDIRPARLYKADGFNTGQISLLRDYHRTGFEGVAFSRVDPPQPDEVFVFPTLTNTAYVVLAILLSLACLAVSGGFFNGPCALVAVLLVEISALIATFFAKAGKIRCTHFFCTSDTGEHFSRFRDSFAKGPPEESKGQSDSNGEDDSDNAPARGQPKKSKATKRQRSSSPAKPTESGDRENNEDDGDANEAPRRGPGRPRKTKKGRPRKQKVPDIEPDQADENQEADKQVFEQVSEILKTKDSALKNANRIAKNLQYAKLKRQIKAKLPDANERSLSELLGEAAVSDRGNIQAQAILANDKLSKWIFTFKREGDDGGDEESGTRMDVPYKSLPKDAPQKDRAALHDELARFYNTWPYSIKDQSQHVKSLWLNEALSNVFASPRQIDQVIYNKKTECAITVHYINKDTGQPESIQTDISVTKKAMEQVAVPPLPPLQILDPESGNLTPRTHDNPHYIMPPRSRSSTISDIDRVAQDALYHMASELQGMVTTTKRMAELITMAREDLGLEKPTKKRSEGLYGGEADLYGFSFMRGTRQIVVYPSRKIVQDLKVTEGANITQGRMHLNVSSLNASRATPVMDTIVQLFSSGMDIRLVWIEAAKSADLVNEDINSGVPPSSACDCDDISSGRERHACEGCGKPTLCKARAYDGMGRLVCPLCHLKEKTSVRGFRDPTESMAAFLARTSLGKNFRKECMLRGLDPDAQDMQNIFKAAWAELKARLPGGGNHENLGDDERTMYKDEYTDMTFDLSEELKVVGGNPSRRRFKPQGLTVDAVHGQGHPKYRHLKHSPGDNLAVTSQACQMAKFVYLPGVLHEIGQWLRMDEQSRQASKPALIARLREMTLVNLKRPYINKGAGTAEAKYSKVMAEAVAGKTADGEHGPWEAWADKFTKHPPPSYNPKAPDDKNLWNRATWEKTQKCAKSIAKYFDVELYELKDGTLWIGSKESNPSDLDRQSLAYLMRERLRRMRLHCNKKWSTQDTEQTLYAEIIFQYCASETKKPELKWLKAKYGDRLGLPLVLWLNNPLRFSIAHRVHGSAMFSGWKSAIPTNVKERIDNDLNNNMLIETWFLNSAKQDIAEEYYPDLDKLITAAKMSLKHYNPGQVDSGQDVVLATEELEIGDEFSVGEFNDASFASTADATDVFAGDSESIDDAPVEDPASHEFAPDEDKWQALTQTMHRITTSPALTTALALDRELLRLVSKAQAGADGAPDFDESYGKLLEKLNQIETELA